MSREQVLSSFDKHFGTISDPRDRRGLRHELRELLLIALLAVICGADEFTEIEDFAKSKRDFLGSFMDLPNGVPSHDTFGRVLSILSPEEFEKSFVAWVSDLCDLSGEIVNIDGKALRRSFDTSAEKSMIYMVSAWANTNNLVLGQLKVADKSNEITAIPKLLEVLDLAGCIVTIDAMGTQREIADQIVNDCKADYVLALKGNQETLRDEVEAAFERFDAKKVAAQNDGVHTDWDMGHGRIEERNCYAVAAADYLSPDILAKWATLQTIVKVEAKITYKNGKKKGEVEYRQRYYITSLNTAAKMINHAIRAHWGIETKLHWVLDVAFREDDSRIRKGHADENMAVLRHIALNKLKNEHSHKRGIKAKRKKAAWSESYLLKVLAA